MKFNLSSEHEDWNIPYWFHCWSCCFLSSYITCIPLLSQVFCDFHNYGNVSNHSKWTQQKEKRLSVATLPNQPSLFSLFLIVLSWTLTFNMLTEACRVWDVALGFFVVSLSIAQSPHILGWNCWCSTPGKIGQTSKRTTLGKTTFNYLL